MPPNAGIRLIAGLGNPGSRYSETAHNAGFWFVDALARGTAFKPESRFMGESFALKQATDSVWLFKPGAFMNRSGLPVKLISDYFKISLPEILVVHDEIDLPPGVVKLKFDGGHGGHNGLRDIFAHMGKAFWRLRIGVGHPGHKDQVIDYVLNRPRKEDADVIAAAMNRAEAIMPQLFAGSFEQAMQTLHGHNPESEGKK